ncbi:Protein kinase-like domain protein, partial [Metarhizium majus ARSEF 297]
MEDLLRYTPSRDAVLTVSPFVNQKFFKRNPGLTEQICVQQAAQLLGCPASSILPAPIQGASSFTVTRSDARPGDLGVVQFRDLSSPLSRDTIALARRTYGHVIPACDAAECGLSDKAHVYLMTLAGGIAFSAAQRNFYQDEGAERLTVTVADFASFVASSLSTARQNTDDALLSQAYEQLAVWEAALWARFQRKLAEMRARLPVIFGRQFPQVLNHADLVEMNMQVDDASGGIAGIVDWENASYGAFGVAIASLEERLRAVFYETLCAELGRHLEARRLDADDVEAARVFGLFGMYGSWAAAGADGHDGDGRGAALAAACLEAGLGEGAAAQPFLRRYWGDRRLTYLGRDG